LNRVHARDELEALFTGFEHGLDALPTEQGHDGHDQEHDHDLDQSEATEVSMDTLRA
jgi:hypothetical protein